MTEPYILAAQGNHDAQADMAWHMLMSGIDRDMPMGTAMTLALTWGLMATTSGKATHLLGYAGLLLADLSRVNDIELDDASYEDQLATVLAVLDVVADAGHDRAELLSNAMAARMPVAVIVKAKALKPQFIVKPLTAEEAQSGDDEMRVIAAALAADAQGVC